MGCLLRVPFGPSPRRSLSNVKIPAIRWGKTAKPTPSQGWEEGVAGRVRMGHSPPPVRWQHTHPGAGGCGPWRRWCCSRSGSSSGPPPWAPPRAGCCGRGGGRGMKGGIRGLGPRGLFGRFQLRHRPRANPYVSPQERSFRL